MPGEGTEFIELVNAEKIKIIGRKTWIDGETLRNAHPWEGARWTREIDDQIKKMAEADQSRLPAERRVVIAEDEEGYRHAWDHLKKRPQTEQQILEALTAPDAHEHFPAGVIQFAHREFDNPRQLVVRILRDAYNHSLALRDAGTRTPFLLNPRESAFNALLREVGVVPDSPESPEAGVLSLDDLAALTSELLGVLASLEGQARGGRAPSVTRFVKGDGHRSLVTWMRHFRNSLAPAHARPVEGQLTARLLDEFNQGTFDDSPRALLGTAPAILGHIGAGSSVAEALVASSLTVFSGVGIAAAALSYGYVWAQSQGQAPTSFSGPDWPFLYAFGRPPTRARQAVISQALDALGTSD